VFALSLYHFVAAWLFVAVDDLPLFLQALHAISASIEEKVVAEFKASQWFGIMMDESTDVANLKQLVVFLRGIVSGEAVTRFVGIVDLPNGEAETITLAVTEMLKSKVRTALCCCLSIPLHVGRSQSVHAVA
jgi:LytS/YehU family sensor histidine kinase